MTPPGNSEDLTDYLLEHDPELQRVAKKLRCQQRRLRQAIGLEHFRVYLLLEEIANEQCLVLAARMWAIASRP